MIITTLLAAAACTQEPGHTSADAPEILRAVPSDALCVGIFGRCDHAAARMLDSTSVLRKLDYGRLGRQKSVIALCNVGSIVPLLIIETGKAKAGGDDAEGLRPATDTLEQTAALASRAAELNLFCEQLAVGSHNAILISPSATVTTVVKRHLSNSTSILDAPYFDRALEAMEANDAIAWRNSGADKLFVTPLCSIPRRQAGSFIKGAAEWTVANGKRLTTIQPEAEKYYCNFLAATEAGRSKLGAAVPQGAELIIDIPIDNQASWRKSFETLQDARVQLESYNKRLQHLKKATGKSPKDWEKELGICEVAYIAGNGYRLNMIRTAKAGKQKEVAANPCTGFVRALFSEPFSDADSCYVCRGNWIISGERSVLDTLQFQPVPNWPDKASAVVQAAGKRLTWTKDNYILWEDSNQ